MSAIVKTPTTDEVLSMIAGDDITIGRMSVSRGGDLSEFDYLPPRMIDITPEDAVQYELFAGEGEESPMFESPGDDPFPLFKTALRQFETLERPARVARIDTDKTYGDFVCEKAVKEISRRVDELQAKLAEHEGDMFAHPHRHEGARMIAVRRQEILGAVAAVSKLKSAKSVEEAAEAMPKVPVDLPPFAEGKVKVWKDGDNVVCSIRFGAKGKARIASMSAKPKVDVDNVAASAVMAGIDPIAILGILPDLADVACGKKLVKDCARAAMEAEQRDDVVGMDDADEPVVLASGGSETAPLAALMYLEQRADAGDEQAQREMAMIERASDSPSGRVIAKPILAESRKRLSAGREKKRASFLGRLGESYALSAGWTV